MMMCCRKNNRLNTWLLMLWLEMRPFSPTSFITSYLLSALSPVLTCKRVTDTSRHNLSLYLDPAYLFWNIFLIELVGNLGYSDNDVIIESDRGSLVYRCKKYRTVILRNFYKTRFSKYWAVSCELRFLESWILWGDSHRSNRSIRGMSRSVSSRSLHFVSGWLICSLGRAGIHVSPVAGLEGFDVHTVFDFTR